MKSYSHSSGAFIGHAGTEIFFQNWAVSSPKGILVLAHGVGEHSGRYNNIIEKLEGSKVSVYAIDHRGHGKSGGKKGHVDQFSDYTNDLKTFIDLIRDGNKNVPIILMGHSMGGVIAFKYALTYSDDLNGLILSSPGLVPAVEIPGWKSGLGKIMSKYFPSLTMSTGLDSAELSRDSDVVEAYDNDPMVHGVVSARWFTEFTSTGEECLNRSLELRMPLLVFHGKEDKICDYKGSISVFNNASSVDKELHIFENLYHETMNELPKDREEVLETVQKWIVNNLSGKKSKSAPKKKASAKKASPKKKASAKKAAPKKKASAKKAAKKAAPKTGARKKAAPKKAEKKAKPKKASPSSKTAKKKSTKSKKKK